MSKEKLTHEIRERSLRLSISRIRRGRAHTTQNTKLTISAVAREAGVSPALIHNEHPKIAEVIREAQGRSSRAQRDNKRQELKNEQEKCRLLRAELSNRRDEVAKLASLNEVLVMKNRELEAMLASTKNVGNRYLQ